MVVVAKWWLESNSNAQVYNNWTDTSMSYNGSNAVFSGSGYILVNDWSGVIHWLSSLSFECFCKVTWSWDQFIMAWREWWWFFIKNNASNLFTSAVYTTWAFRENTLWITWNDWKRHHIWVNYDWTNKVSYVDWKQAHTVWQTGTLRDNSLWTPRYIQFWANRQSWPAYNNKLTWWVRQWIIHNSSNPAVYYKNRRAYLKWFI